MKRQSAKVLESKAVSYWPNSAILRNSRAAAFRRAEIVFANRCSNKYHRLRALQSVRRSVPILIYLRLRAQQQPMDRATFAMDRWQQLDSTINNSWQTFAPFAQPTTIHLQNNICSLRKVRGVCQRIQCISLARKFIRGLVPIALANWLSPS